MRAFFLGIFWFLTSALAFAQQGSLTGKVTDKKTGEGVIGATVLVTGTTQAAPVDVQGSYELALDPGTYNITITYVGYKPLTFPGIVITSGAKTTLDAVMAEDATSLSEVTVTGVKQTGTEVALIQDLKQSEVVVSGVSNDQIVRTLDRDAAEVVKRIPGVTVQSNNFIVIRGLAERYNTVLLNDALTPSAEVDTRSFSFDILPSSVIDRILIFKSGAPELQGEFGGGIVKVFTRNSVLENSTSLTVSGWARSTNTFKNGFLQSNHSSTDFLGFDNGQRELPGILGNLSPQTNSTEQQLAGLRGSLRNEFVPRSITSRPDLRISLGVNRKFEIGKVYVSNVTSISYANTQEQNTSLRQRFTTYDASNPGQLPGKVFDYQDTRSLSAVRLGIIHNYQVRLNDRNRVEFRNFFNQYGTDEVVRRQGLNLENSDPQERNDYALHYQSRSIYSGQLGGNHEVGPAGRTTVTWAAGYNYVNRDEPDYRQNQQTRNYVQGQPGELNPLPFRVEINSVPTTSSRFYATLTENTYMGSGQLEYRFAGRDTLSANQYKVRLGFYAEEKERNYNSRYFNYARGTSFDEAGIGSQPLETIFSPTNLNPTTGLVLRESTQAQDRYNGQNRLVAGYLSGVAPLSERLNLSGGVRVEYNRKYLASPEAQTAPYEEVRTFMLPSLNATYNFNDRSVLRAGVSESVNRPEFREVAEYQYYDFGNNFSVRGSNNLKTARIYNADLRYEFYPTRSELLSIGVFGKRFYDAIEQVTLSTTGSDLVLTYQNADRAYDVGVEVEARKSLIDLSENRFLQRISFVLNASLIRSRVDLDTTLLDNRKFALSNRPLQGQSPYVVNLGVFYQDDEAHWQVSAQYNIIGPRIAFVGDLNQNFSVIELPRHVVDLGLTKGIGSHFEVRAGIQNMLNQEVRQYYDFDRNGKINGVENGAAFARYKRGTYSTLGATFRF
ncbi:TonB-dependent receptor domain-containing protein [uncultured Hymenobacter sp.]|uniref:TonB-dependent receptor n=1 Tax=uncultured Hymenobacter sp. TaxID=170016 RepID=UPI0035CC96A4